MTTVQFLRHGDQAVADAIDWHKNVNPMLTTKQLDAFQAGYKAAWIAALADIKLHGMPKND